MEPLFVCVKLSVKPMKREDYAETNRQLLTRAAEGDQSAVNELVNANLGLVHSVVKRFLNRGHEAEDLFQIGCIGLIKAAQKFDLSFQVKFSTYAIPVIMGEIKRYIRDDGMIKVSRSLKESAHRAALLREKLTSERGCEPTITELAEKLDITPEELSTALDAGRPHESLYAQTDDGNREGKTLIEKIENQTDYESEIINRMTIQEALQDFSERDKTIIQLRYYDRKTQTQIAELLGISQVQVSRIEKKLLSKMREKMIE